MFEYQIVNQKLKVLFFISNTEHRQLFKRNGCSEQRLNSVNELSAGCKIFTEKYESNNFEQALTNIYKKSRILRFAG